MTKKIDLLDRKILDLLQKDAEISLDEIATKIGSSRTPVWSRIRKLKANGVIKRVVAEVDPQMMGLENCFFVMVRTSSHVSDWLQQFTKTVNEIPEIVEAHRLAGEIDYVLKVYVKSAQDFDEFYQKLVKKVEIFNVTSTLSMEVVKPYQGIPIDSEQ